MSKRFWRALRPFSLLVGLLWLAVGATASQTQPLFWQISYQGEPRGHLLGTIHSEASQVLDFSEEFLGLLGNSRVFAMELVPNLPTLAALADRMRLPDGVSLESIAGQERFAAVRDALQGYGVPAAQVGTMQPWAAMMTLSMPPPKTGLFMDFSLSLRASGAGAEVVALETLDQQLAFLQGMDLDQQLSLLDHALAELPRVMELHDEMVRIYLQNDLEALYRETTRELAGVPEPARRAFIEQGITARNRNMLESVLPRLQEGGVFIAVGALHLAGEEGLLALLAGQGYTLEPAAWPFRPQP